MDDKNKQRIMPDADPQRAISALTWWDRLDGREQAEVKLARFYAKQPHGTAGHNRLLLIAKLADLLDGRTDLPVG